MDYHLDIIHLPSLRPPSRDIILDFWRYSISLRTVRYVIAMASAICDMVAVGVFSNRWIISNWREDNSFCPSFCPSFRPLCGAVRFSALTIFSSSLTCINSGCSISWGLSQCFSCQALRMRGNLNIVHYWTHYKIIRYESIQRQSIRNSPDSALYASQRE